MATIHKLASSATPTHPRASGEGQRSSSSFEDGSVGGSWRDPASKPSRNIQPTSIASTTNTLGHAQNTQFASARTSQGSFSSDLKNATSSRSTTPRADPGPHGRGKEIINDGSGQTTEQKQAIIRGEIEKELKIKTGTENMLEALLTKNPKQTKAQRLKVESELSSSNRKLTRLYHELEEELQRARAPSNASTGRLSGGFGGGLARSLSGATQTTGEDVDDNDSETESPTYVLAETLQTLEVEGMPSDYYVERANSLVDLFNRHPTLKYDLEWSVFGLRVQMMLLSESREIVAAGYRLIRYAIADRKSIKLIRSLHTDELAMLSLVKETKATMEREQALKFIRAFLDVKDGVHELSRSVVRTLVSIAEHREDRLRNICIMTLAELLIKGPELLFSSGGIGILNDALGEGVFGATESLAAGFVHVLDAPRSRKFLQSGCELDTVFANFTETNVETDRTVKLKASAKAISGMLKTWPGLLTLAQNKARPLQSLLDSLQYPDSQARDLVLELLFDAFRIKPPSWSSSFLAGRRLTTYGRVADLRSDQDIKHARSSYEQDTNSFDLTTHFSALVLVMFIEAGLINVSAFGL